MYTHQITPQYLHLIFSIIKEKGCENLRSTIYNNIVTKENIVEINPDNLKLLDEWLMYLRAANKSKQTVVNYKSDIRIFFVYLLKKADNKFFGNIVPRDIVFFQNWCMEELKLSSNRICRLKDVLSSFSNYVEDFYKDDERLKDFENITRAIKNPPKTKVREETLLTEQEINLIFEKLIDKSQYKAACLLALALYGGLRKAELVQIEIETFDKENIVGSLYKTPNKITLKGGYKNEVYFLKQEVDRFVYLWKRERKRQIKRFGEPPEEIKNKLFSYVRCGEWNLQKLSMMHYVANVITKVMKENGINKVFYWESARKYFVQKVNQGVKDPLERKLLLQNI